jgi:hypothetical protein
MPNHVTTTFRISGPVGALAAFRARHFTQEDGETTLDFNTVIPMPEILKGSEASSAVDDAIEALTGDRQYEFGRASWSAEQEAALAARLRALTPEQLEAGRRALRAKKETGHTAWYSWCIENWGTKWGAYAFYVIEETPTSGVYRFDTAWSTPVPVFEALAALHPELAFTTDSYDEGGGFAAHGEASAGEFTEETFEPTDEAYEAAYGEPREDDEEEDGE